MEVIHSISVWRIRNLLFGRCCQVPTQSPRDLPDCRRLRRRTASNGRPHIAIGLMSESMQIRQQGQRCRQGQDFENPENR